ncbi:pre-rRNA-processing protein TSR2 homolog isoform X2 [Pseudomyrmex gracilis]|uniref:pre-rRNA-processing protein TSR2 homolog isoform X2 n=1 Tax=Pseudomyrmex gracilis TaxID=219809 RepID=UPI000994FEBA|nr:pre-rRNA-processing protein TSR2 homolog isoform X2 [Pseudomyrmex gracilis]
MEETKQFFLSVNRRIFSNWTALRLAVENDMGPLEQAIEFCSYTTDLIYMNDITISELAEELEGYMDDQFNTEVHDDSCTAVATDLLKFFHYCTKGDESNAREDLEKLPPEQPWLSKSPPQYTHPVPVKHNSSSEEDMEVDVNEKDDGWTMVKNRRNR